MKVLEFMVYHWGHIPFWSWAFATFVIMVIVNQIKLYLKL